MSVVVTGVGAQCAFGDVPALIDAVGAGRSAVRMTQFDAMQGLPPVPAAVTPEVSPVEFLRDRKLQKYMSPAARLAVVAAGRALRRAGLLEDQERRGSLAVFVATGLIAFDLDAVSRAITESRAEDGTLDLQRLGAEGLRSCPPLMPFKMLLNMPLGLVSIAFGIRGANFIVYPGAAQAGVCLEAAVRGIETGRFDRALVGGTTQGLSLMPLATLLRSGRLAASEQAAKPFLPGHAGLAPSDGAAFLVIEHERAAAERGHEPLAHIRRPVIAHLAPTPDNCRALWLEAAGESVPGEVITTGSCTEREDALDVATAGACWPMEVPHLTSFDGSVGWIGAGALPLAAAAASMRIDRGSSVLIAAHDADGALALTAIEAARRTA